MSDILFISENSKADRALFIERQLAKILPVKNHDISDDLQDFIQQNPPELMIMHLINPSIHESAIIARILTKVHGIPVILAGPRDICHKYYVANTSLIKRFIVTPVRIGDYFQISRDYWNKLKGIQQHDEKEAEVIEEIEFEKKKLLVVDDDPIALRTVVNWTKDSYKIAAVKSGLAALEALKKEKPDLILLDYMMPGLSGTETLEKIKAHPEFSDIPVIFLTSVTDAEMIKEALKFKPEGYILKSSGKIPLMNKIMEVLTQTE